ncbi:hypothetical protein AB0I54_48005, partial [Streptomyces sp. NPDC050625]|uniref:hypothetical protein n=1 Tax=Streptomyces sp. NPDC050625 TaxID=3154629 RepID=UPI0034183BDD
MTVIKQHGLRHDRDRRTNPAVAGRTDQCIHSKEGTSREATSPEWSQINSVHPEPLFIRALEPNHVLTN